MKHAIRERSRSSSRCYGRRTRGSGIGPPGGCESWGRRKRVARFTTLDSKQQRDDLAFGANVKRHVQPNEGRVSVIVDEHGGWFGPRGGAGVIGLIALAAAAACTAPPPPPEPPRKPRNACEAADGEKEPRPALLGCATDTICASFVSRGVAQQAGGPRLDISCESRRPLQPLTAPILRLRLRAGDVYDSVLLYRATWQDDRWRAELVDELPVEAEWLPWIPEVPLDRRRPLVSRLRLAEPPVLSFDVRGGVGVVRELPASSGAPLLLSRMEPSKRIEEREGTSLWLAPDLRWWTRRAEAGIEAYRLVLSASLGFSFQFEAERRGTGGVLAGHCSCGAHRQWQLSADEWQGLRERGIKILDAESEGGHCGKDGYSTRMEAVVEGRWRVVERQCDTVGGLLSSLASRQKELVQACPPRE